MLDNTWTSFGSIGWTSAGSIGTTSGPSDVLVGKGAGLGKVHHANSVRGLASGEGSGWGLAWPLLVLLEVGFGVKQDGLDAQDR